MKNNSPNAAFVQTKCLQISGHIIILHVQICSNFALPEHTHTKQSWHYKNCTIYSDKQWLMYTCHCILKKWRKMVSVVWRIVHCICILSVWMYEKFNKHLIYCYVWNGESRAVSRGPAGSESLCHIHLKTIESIQNTAFFMNSFHSMCRINGCRAVWSLWSSGQSSWLQI
jgi:hypothetical protein